MRNSPWISAAILAAALAWPHAGAIAQIPPHVPGSICVTQQFWCWALYSGPPGTRCACRSQYGWVQGVLI